MSNYIRFYNSDYNYVFITIVTYNRQQILLDNIDLLRNAFKYSMNKHKFKIYACNILKDHIHLILELESGENYSEIIRLTKYYYSKNMDRCIDNIPESKKLKREKCIWQRRFWEHTIRNKKDLYQHVDYIHYNSFKHYNIPPCKWQYSTFNKFVAEGLYDKNWCNYDDINNIESLNLE